MIKAKWSHHKRKKIYTGIRRLVNKHRQSFVDPSEKNGKPR